MNDQQVPTSLLAQIKRDIRVFRQLDGKKRFQFIWDYYKIPIFLLILGIYVTVLLGRIIWEGQKPCRLRACIVLNTEADCSEWCDSFTEQLVADGKPGSVDFNLDQLFDYENQYNYVQEMKVMTTISSSQMDIAVCNADMYSYLLALNACMPLDTCLPPELYSSLSTSGKIDHSIANLHVDENGKLQEEDGIEGDYGILLNGTSFAKEYNQPANPSAEEEPLYAVIITNTEHLEDCLAMIQKILE